MKKVLAAIARKTLYIETLETRNSDSLDFSDQAVWSIEQALMEAYKAGQQSCAKEVWYDTQINKMLMRLIRSKSSKNKLKLRSSISSAEAKFGEAYGYRINYHWEVAA